MDHSNVKWSPVDSGRICHDGQALFPVMREINYESVTTGRFSCTDPNISNSPKQDMTYKRDESFPPMVGPRYKAVDEVTVLEGDKKGLTPNLLERYSRFYYSPYVAKNQPWILQIPFDEWVERQLRLRGE